MIDLSFKIDRMFSIVGNVSGKIIENKTTSTMVKIGNPNTGARRHSFCIVESVSNSALVGSSAVDLIEELIVQCTLCGEASEVARVIDSTERPSPAISATTRPP